MISNKESENGDLFGDLSIPLMSRALSVAADGIVITSLKLPGEPVIYINDGFQKITQYSREDVLGTNCRFLQGADTDPNATEQIRNAITNREECVIEILNYRKDGTPFWNRLSLTPVRVSSGETTHYIGIQTDVTARREAEDKLKSVNLRMKRNLSAAARIQGALLPINNFKMGNFSFSYMYRPSEELAGDNLNIVPLDERYAAVYTLDVSGHGVQSSLLSVTLNYWLSPHSGRSAIYSKSSGSGSSRVPASPAEVAETLNEQFQMDSETLQYFTMMYGLLDTEEGEFIWVSAGSPPLIHQSRSGTTSKLTYPGFPIGISDNPEYTTQTIKLESGDKIFAFTDGVTDVMNSEGLDFGEENLVKIISGCSGRNLNESISLIENAMDEWAHSPEFDDDATMLVFEFNR